MFQIHSHAGRMKLGSGTFVCLRPHPVETWQPCRSAVPVRQAGKAGLDHPLYHLLHEYSLPSPKMTGTGVLLLTLYDS